MGTAYPTFILQLRGDTRSIQYLPWLILGGKLNFNAILDRPPSTYWYRVTEIYALLTSVGFEIVALGTDTQISADCLKTTDSELLGEKLSRMLCVVVRKQ